MRDATLLLTIALASVVIVPVGLVIRAKWKSANDPLNEDADGESLIDHCGWVDCPEAFGRVPQAAPGSREPSPTVSAASGFDPSRGGTLRAFNDGE